MARVMEVAFLIPTSRAPKVIRVVTISNPARGSAAVAIRISE